MRPLTVAACAWVLSDFDAEGESLPALKLQLANQQLKSLEVRRLHLLETAAHWRATVNTLTSASGESDLPVVPETAAAAAPVAAGLPPPPTLVSLALFCTTRLCISKCCTCVGPQRAGFATTCCASLCAVSAYTQAC